MIHIFRRDNEGVESVARRFMRATQNSRLVNLKKDLQFFRSPITRRQRRRAAQLYQQRRTFLAHQIKIGKVPPGTRSLKKRRG